MRRGGDDLSTVRPVHFQLVFRTRHDAQAFAEAVRAKGLLVTMGDGGDGPEMGLPWDVTVTIAFRPEPASLSTHERDLSAMALVHGGRGDGWFCERIIQDAP
jgi:hypothetical protein